MSGQTVRGVFSGTVPGEMFPLKEIRVREDLGDPAAFRAMCGELIALEQFYKQQLENLERDAIALKNEFGMRRFDAGTAGICMQLHDSTTSRTLRWEIHWSQ